MAAAFLQRFANMRREEVGPVLVAAFRSDTGIARPEPAWGGVDFCRSHSSWSQGR